MREVRFSRFETQGFVRQSIIRNSDAQGSQAISTSLSTRIRTLEHLGTHGWWIQIETPSSVQLNPPHEEFARQLDKGPAEIVDSMSISDVNAMLVTLVFGTVAIGLISLGLLNVRFNVITYGLVDLLRLFSGMS